MSIDLALYLTSSSTPQGAPDDDALRLAHCRATVPVAWWLLFDEDEIITGPYGPMMRAKAAAALERLRGFAPRLRAAAGRHALGLRHMERALARHQGWWIEAYISELYYSASLEVLRGELRRAQQRPGLETLWVTMRHGRFIQQDSPTSQLSDHIVGAYAPSDSPQLTEDALITRLDDALKRGDAQDLDLLEEALYLQQREALAPFDVLLDALEPARHVGASHIQGCDARLERWLGGDDSALDDLAAWQLPALRQAAQQRDNTFKSAARRRLRSDKRPITAIIAQALDISPPQALTLDYVRWERGAQAPIHDMTRRAVLACRCVALGAPSAPLCLADPLAIVERAMFWEFSPTIDIHSPPWALAIRRALCLTKADLSAWLELYVEPHWQITQYTNYHERLGEALCASLAAHPLDEDERSRLLALPTPDEPALSGQYRALARLALGDEALLEPLIHDHAAPPHALTCAIEAADLAPRCLDWLDGRVAQQKSILAATLLARCQTFTPAMDALLQDLDTLSSASQHYQEGLITYDELEAQRQTLRQLHAALIAMPRSPARLDLLDQAIAQEP